MHMHAASRVKRQGFDTRAHRQAKDKQAARLEYLARELEYGHDRHGHSRDRHPALAARSY